MSSDCEKSKQDRGMLIALCGTAIHWRGAMMQRSRVILVAATAWVSFSGFAPFARAASNPKASIITVSCGLMDDPQPEARRRCDGFDLGGGGKTGKVLDGTVEFWSGNVRVAV